MLSVHSGCRRLFISYAKGTKGTSHAGSSTGVGLLMTKEHGPGWRGEGGREKDRRMKGRRKGRESAGRLCRCGGGYSHVSVTICHPWVGKRATILHPDTTTSRPWAGRGPRGAQLSPAGRDAPEAPRPGKTRHSDGNRSLAPPESKRESGSALGRHLGWETKERWGPARALTPTQSRAAPEPVPARPGLCFVVD